MCIDAFTPSYLSKSITLAKAGLVSLLLNLFLQSGFMQCFGGFSCAVVPIFFHFGAY